MHFNNIFVFANTFLVFCLFAFQLHIKKFKIKVKQSGTEGL